MLWVCWVYSVCFRFLFWWLGGGGGGGGGGVAAVGVGNGFVGGVKDHRLPDNPLSLWVFITGRK